jgi:imidazolonepropionase-like amidohydrolase
MTSVLFSPASERQDTTMKALRIVLLLSALLSLAACGRQYSPGITPVGSGQIIITNGTVVDGRGSEPVHDGIVVIVGDRITFVGRAADYSRPVGAQVIDARGGTILPGIIDAHVHDASDPAIRRQFLTSGVTTVCDLGSPLEDMPRFAEEYMDQVPVARGFRAGPILTAPGGLPGAVLQASLNYEVGTPEEARAAVVDLSERGADVIKVYLQEEGGGATHPMLGEDELAAIVEKARGLGLLVRAHVTYAFLLDDAIQAGVDTIEHVPINATQSESQSIPESQWRAFYESNLEKMVEAGIVMIPTLDRPYGKLYRASDPTPAQQAAMEGILAIVGGFHERGGVVGLGTDWASGTDRQAGMPVGEMEMLLAAGLGPMDVIQAGTRVSAYACGHGDELGTLEPGKLADVIVVDGDPLEDLQAMTEVVLVIRNGEIAFISEGMLSAAE